MTTIIERPYKVFTGNAKQWINSQNAAIMHEAHFEFSRGFHTRSDAEAYAERISEDYEFVKIEEKENN